MEIKIVDTPEKFRPLAEEIVPPLLELLRARNDLEREIHDRSQALEAEKPALGIPRNQIHPDDPALWEEFRRRYLELVQNRCIPGFLKYGAAGSFGKPTKYGYLDDDPQARVVFTMKSTKKAVVEVWGHNGSLEIGHRLTLRPSERGWLIAKVEYHFGSGDDWHIDHYV